MNNTGTKTIRTDRLLLRKMHMFDYFAFSKWYCQPELAAFSQRTQGATRYECFDFLLRRVYNYYFKRRKNYYAWSIVLDGKMAGFVMLNDVKQDVFSVYYMLSPAYQGNGYMKEALAAVMSYMKTQRCRAVLGSCDSKNTASSHVLQACGFRRYDTKEGAFHYRDGRVGDSEKYVYELKPKNGC